MTALSPTLPETPVQAPTRSIDDVLFAVHVDEEDIALGVPMSGQRCPIRRAAFRQLVMAGYTPTDVMIGSVGAHVWIDGQIRYFTHGGERFVSAYDHDLPVEPCVVNFTCRSER